MKKIILLPSFLLLISITSFSQVELNPSIGIGTLPDNEEPICDIPLYLGNFNDSGFFDGNLIPDFNLFDLDGNELIMSERLDQGKPVLLVAGNYTCYVFRDRVSEINNLVSLYGDEIEIIIIYGVEAHPIVDISPYFGYVNTGSPNISSGITYEQPKTYGERKAIVADMLSDMDIQAPVYIDGPCNEWWTNFGPAPNNAYLIGTDGIILKKHHWFDKYPNDIYCDIENFLGIPADCTPAGGENGDFSFELTSEAQMEGPAGQTIYVTGLLENESDEGVEIEVFRLVEDLPTGWETSLCTDVCYPSSVTQALVWLEAGESLIYTNYFYTDETPGSGMVKIGFRNTQDNSNQFQQWMSATSYTSTSIKEQTTKSIKIYPNPVKTDQTLGIHLPEGLSLNYFELFQSDGTKAFAANSLPTQSLAPGIYWYRCHLSNGSTQSGTVMVY